VLVVKTLSSAADFSALRSEWESLVADNHATTIFQTWEWMNSWWETYGSAHRLHLLVARDQSGALCGIAPLMIRWERVGPLPVRVLEFIAGHSVASEYLDFISAPGMEREVANTFVGHLLERGGWGLWRSYQMKEGSVTRQVLMAQAAARGLHLSPVADAPALFIALPKTWDEYLSKLRHHARNNLRRHRRRIEEAGGFNVVDRSDDPDALGEFVKLHVARMRDANRVTSFESDAFSRFHAVIAERARQLGRLRLLFLHREGRPVAALYGFALHGRWYFYNTGSDPSLREHHVAAFLLSCCIERCIGEGMTEFDFLGPGEYKERWAVEERHKVTFSVSRSPLIMAAQRVEQRGWGWVRGAVARLIPVSLYRSLGNTYRQLGLRVNRPLR
jgi:CelD/BcsL family acetyltransferase involved in cellulose biosynthesis